MKLSQIKAGVLLLSGSLVLLSCSMVPKHVWDASDADATVEEVKAKASRNGIIITNSAQAPKLVRVSKTAPWLDDSIISNYRDLNAKTAILGILEQRPIRFDVSSSGPLVKALPRASTIRQHLDAIAVQANWAYTVNKGVITFSDWQVINYPLDFIVSNKQAELGIEGTLSNNPSRNTMSVNSNALDELTEIMERIIDSADQSQDQMQRKISFSVIKATNSILVSAPPDIHRKIEYALDSINRIAGRSIYIDFDIFTVELKEEYQRALDIDILRQSGINVTSKITSDILVDSATTPFLLQLDFPKSSYIDSSQILLKALATHGEASLTSQGTLLLKNNEVGNILASSLDRFVKIEIPGEIVSSTPAYKESVVQVLPSIVNDEINLHLVLSNTDVEPYLKSLKRLPYNTSQGGTTTSQFSTEIEMANIKLGEQFVIPTQISHGETLMIAGLINKNYENKKARNQLVPVVGDNISRDQVRREIIIVITAYLVD